MADTKTSLMTNASTLTGAEEWHGTQGGLDRAISADQVKTWTLTSPVAVVGNATSGSSIRLPEDTDNGSNYVAIKAPDSLSATYTLTLPSDDGSADQYLKTDGSGGLSWATVSGASAPLTLASGTITDPSTALTITQTWNDAADTFIAMDMTVTNTASATASRLMQLKYGAAASETTRFAVDPRGAIYISDGTNTACLSVVDVASSDCISTHQLGTSTQHNILGNTFVVVSRYGSNPSDFDTLANIGAGVTWASTSQIQWSDAATNLNTIDTRIYRVGAGVVGIRGTATSAGAALNLLEQTAPSAPSANQVVVYAEDNGSGKTRLMALFNTGAAQQIAIEP